MKEQSKNPMSTMLHELAKGHSGDANGALSKLWRRCLWQLNMTGIQWSRLLDRWRANAIPVLGETAVDTKKGNLLKALASSDMSWKSFIQGLQVLNATGKYKTIRFEIHLVPARRGVTEIIGINVTDVKADEQKASDLLSAEVIVPGMVAVPGKHYRAKNFTNNGINGSTFTYIGEEPKTILDSEFNGCVLVGVMLLDNSGGESLTWRVINNLEELKNV